MGLQKYVLRRGRNDKLYVLRWGARLEKTLIESQKCLVSCEIRHSFLLLPTLCKGGMAHNNVRQGGLCVESLCYCLVVLWTLNICNFFYAPQFLTKFGVLSRQGGNSFPSLFPPSLTFLLPKLLKTPISPYSLRGRVSIGSFVQWALGCENRVPEKILRSKIFLGRGATVL